MIYAPTPYVLDRGPFHAESVSRLAGAPSLVPHMRPRREQQLGPHLHDSRLIRRIESTPATAIWPRAETVVRAWSALVVRRLLAAHFGASLSMYARTSAGRQRSPELTPIGRNPRSNNSCPPRHRELRIVFFAQPRIEASSAVEISGSSGAGALHEGHGPCWSRCRATPPPLAAEMASFRGDSVYRRAHGIAIQMHCATMPIQLGSRHPLPMLRVHDGRRVRPFWGDMGCHPSSVSPETSGVSRNSELQKTSDVTPQQDS
ncbi:hypothetical protein SAMN05421642_103233 [Rhodococcoides kyotonense]|uniref:Uncharacterized protein n=1 Tax=Rhodococcoides kyotonense TaxID=398843 RepID=A0A239FD91_9NOCA|nr:hypothetical protein SAMN05421642_103233 [Rhodococcus kyotonensis]